MRGQKMTRRRTILFAIALLAGGCAVNIAVAWSIALGPRAAATRFATDFGPPHSFDSVAYARRRQAWPPMVNLAVARGPGYERRLWSMHRFGEYRIWSGREAIDVPLDRAATLPIETVAGAWGLLQPHRAHWIDGADGVEEAFGWPLLALRGAWLRDADDRATWRTRGAIGIRRPAGQGAGRLLPLRPLPGFAINALLYAAALAAPLLTFSRLRARVRARRGCCPRCGYDTTGLIRCPECGATGPAAPRSTPGAAP